MIVSFEVRADPVPQGSMVPLRSRNTGEGGRIFMKPNNEKQLKAWRRAVQEAALVRMKGVELLDGPLELAPTFYLPRRRPNKRAKCGYTQLDVGREFPDVQPDLDKLVRAVGDALKGHVYTDDARVVKISAEKRWEEGWTGVLIAVAELGERERESYVYQAELFRPEPQIPF